MCSTRFHRNAGLGCGETHQMLRHLRRISLGQRVCLYIGIRVQSSAKSDRVTFLVSPYVGVIVPEIVVVKVRLLVEILPREPEVELIGSEARRILIGRIDAKGLKLIPFPPELLARIVDCPRRVEMIDV
jgi:hypothetical protein